MNFLKRIVSTPVDNEEPAPQPEPRKLDYDDLQRSSVLYSNFRSGTHFTKSLIAKYGDVTCLTETFNLSLHGGQCYSLRDYLQDDDVDPVRALANSGATVFDLLPRVYAKCPEKGQVLFDMKYSQAYALGMHEGLMVPTILQELTKAKLPVIHLIRRDVVAQSVSLLVAEQTGQFHAKDGQEDQSRKIWLDPEAVRKMALSRQRAIADATRHLQALDAKVLTVFYEDLAFGDTVAQLRRIFKFIDHYVDLPTEVEANTKDQKSASRVANMDEIIERIGEVEPGLVTSVH